MNNVVELVGGGSVINGAHLVSFYLLFNLAFPFHTNTMIVGMSRGVERIQ